MEQRDAQMGSILVQIIEQRALIPEEQVEEVAYHVLYYAILVIVVFAFGISLRISNIDRILS